MRVRDASTCYLPVPVRAGCSARVAVSDSIPQLDEAEQDRNQLLEEQRRKAEEKEAVAQQLAQVKQTIRSDRDEQIRARHRLKELQAKLVVGGSHLLEKEQEQEKQHRQLEEELAERRREEQVTLAAPRRARPRRARVAPAWIA